MPKATLASRPIKNKDTGIDMYVTSYRETKGMMTSTVHYQVVLVSNLSCFKTPSHKESDVVQFSIEKKFSEFEQLRADVVDIFPETMLPPINKKAIIMNDGVLRDRRNNLNTLLKFLASTQDIATCTPVLEFLGIDRLRALQFSPGEPLARQTNTSEDNAKGLEDGEDTQESDINFLVKDNDDDEGEENLFGDTNEQDESDIFSTKGQVQMFTEQDLKRDISEEDEKEFSFIPNAIITKREKVKVGLDREEEEDNSELFRIEDDLDDLLKIDVTKNTSHQKVQEMKSSKPQVPVKPNKYQQSVSDNVSNLDQDDILKYLQDSTTQNEEEVDLFS